MTVFLSLSLFLTVVLLFNFFSFFRSFVFFCAAVIAVIVGTAPAAAALGATCTARGSWSGRTSTSK